MLKRVFLFPGIKQKAQACDTFHMAKADYHLTKKHLENLEIPVSNFIEFPREKSSGQHRPDLYVTSLEGSDGLHGH